MNTAGVMRGNWQFYAGFYLEVNMHSAIQLLAAFMKMKCLFSTLLRLIFRPYRESPECIHTFL
jgi:hypothetical protein